MPVLILGTYRDVELDVARPLARTLEELLRQRLAHRITLRRLPQDGVSAMLRALSGQEPPQPLVDAVYSETEGNPFFVEEVFQHLAEEGKLFDAKGRWRSDLQVSELDVPEGVRLVIGRRLERVGEECRRVLTSAAVIGRGFSFELLEELSEADTDALLDAIDEAERAQLITAAEDGPAQTGARMGEARFRFAHELIRQTLVSGLSLPRRQRLHLRIAGAMERAYSRAPEEHVADLAHHFHQAGAAADPEKTVRYLTLAGERALGAAAFEDAVRNFEWALSLQPEDNRQAGADLLYKRGLARRSLGRWEEALTDWRQALEAYEALGDAEAVGRVSFELAEQSRWSGRLEEAVQLARRGLTAVGKRASADRCRLLATEGLALGFFGAGTAAAEPQLAEALAIAEELDDPRLLGQVLRAKASLAAWHSQPVEAANTALRSARLLRSAGDLSQLADVLTVAQVPLLLLGRLDEVGEIVEEIEPLAARLGHVGALHVASEMRALRELMVTGDLERFEEFGRDHVAFSQKAGFTWLSNSYTYLGLALFWRGRWQEALENLQEAARLEPPGVWAGLDWSALLLCRAYAGRKEEALAMLREKMAALSGSGQPSTLGNWTVLFSMVEALALLGERAEASKLYPSLLELCNTGIRTSGLHVRLVQAVAGIAAACGGQWAKAEEHYQRALRQAQEIPVVIEQPEVRRFYARMLIDRDGPGDRDKARELLTEAIDMYRKIGMPKHVEMAEALLSEAAL